MVNEDCRNELAKAREDVRIAEAEISARYQPMLPQCAISSPSSERDHVLHEVGNLVQWEEVIGSPWASEILKAGGDSDKYGNDLHVWTMPNFRSVSGARLQMKLEKRPVCAC